MADMFICWLSVGTAVAVVAEWIWSDCRRAARRRRKWRRMDAARAVWRARVLASVRG